MEDIYAAILLHKIGKEINEENIKNILKAAGKEINPEEEAKIKALVVSLKGVDIEKELESATLVQPSETKVEKEEKKELVEEKKEEAAEGLSALFG